MTITKKSRVFLGAAIGSGALAIISLFIFDAQKLQPIYHASGFYFMFASFFIWLFMMLPRQYSKERMVDLAKSDGWVIALIVLVTACMYMVSPVQFRVLADETNLLGVANSMFLKHSFANLTDSLYYFQQQHVVREQWGIRPTFYPFLIYLVHSIKGYSAYNGFIVNFFAGLGSLFCLYWLLKQWFHQYVAVLGMLLLAATPVYVLWVTSTGFEIVNLCLALISFCLLYKYLQTKESIFLERLILTLILLAQTRYESSVFIIALGLVVLASLRWNTIEKLSLRIAVLPWLFLPIAWQRLLKSDKSDYQVYNDEAVFSFAYWKKHMATAWDYFTATQERYATIGFVFFVALAGIALAVINLIRRRKTITALTWHMIAAATLSLGALIAVVFSYYWGNLVISFTIRLGIIFMPFVIFAFCYLVQEIISSKWIKLESALGTKITVVFGLALCLWYWPVAAKNEAVEQLTLNRQYQVVLAYLQEEFPNANNLIISDRPGLYSVHQWGAVSMNYANRNVARIERELSRHLYQDAIAIQIINYSDGKAIKGTNLNEEFELETLYEAQFNAVAKIVISRVLHD